MSVSPARIAAGALVQRQLIIPFALAGFLAATTRLWFASRRLATQASAGGIAITR